ncbi:MAG: hypothetical protein U0791_23225 [Gemmataceae bacterium]
MRRHCPLCYHAARVPLVAKGLGRVVLFSPHPPPPAVAPPAVASTRSLPLLQPCRHEGDIFETCSCPLEHDRKDVRHCLHPDPQPDRDFCTRGHEQSTHQRCNACPQYEAREPARKPVPAAPPPRVDALAPRRVVRVNLPDHFNASIIDHGGRSLLASRVFESVCLSELDADFQPIWTRLLPLYHSRSANGAEDPRLFVAGEKLHVAFSGVSVDAGGQVIVSVLHARLNDDLYVERVWEPMYERRQKWEKNWAAFEVDGVLYSVYDAGPQYTVLRHDGDQAVPFAEHQWRPQWSGGLLRGGAAPVRVGDEWWHFAHGVRKTPQAIDTDYTLGLYTFDAAPPFAPRRIVPTPLLFDHGPRPRTENPAIYPCGAIRRGDRWFVSYGLHNSHVEIVEYSHDDLERLLVPA